MVLTGAEAKLSNEGRVTSAKPLAEFNDEGLQVLPPFLGGMDVPEETSQGVGQELVAEVVQGDQLVQDVPSDYRCSKAGTQSQQK